MAIAAMLGRCLVCIYLLIALIAPAAAQSVFGGRLTLTGGTPVTTADVVGATEIFYSPTGDVGSGLAPFYSGGAFVNLSFLSNTDPTDKIGLSLSLDANASDENYHAANTNFDVFHSNNGTANVLCSGPSWNAGATPGNDQTQGQGAGSSQHALYHGVDSNTFDMRCRYGVGSAIFTCPANQCVWDGTFRTTAAGQTEDSAKRRLLSNAHNVQPRPMLANDPSQTTWQWNNAGWEQAHNNPANQVEYVQGGVGPDVEASAISLATNSSTGIVFAHVGIGIDNALAAINQTGGLMTVGLSTTLWAQGEVHYKGFPGIGHHTLLWLEYGAGAGNGTTSWLGTNAAGLAAGGISGTVYN